MQPFRDVLEKIAFPSKKFSKFQEKDLIFFSKVDFACCYFEDHQPFLILQQ